jgi:hypothetical protein
MSLSFSPSEGIGEELLQLCPRSLTSIILDGIDGTPHAVWDASKILQWCSLPVQRLILNSNIVPGGPNMICGDSYDVTESGSLNQVSQSGSSLESPSAWMYAPPGLRMLRVPVQFSQTVFPPGIRSISRSGLADWLLWPGNEILQFCSLYGQETDSPSPSGVDQPIPISLTSLPSTVTSIELADVSIESDSPIWHLPHLELLKVFRVSPPTSQSAVQLKVLHAKSRIDGALDCTTLRSLTSLLLPTTSASKLLSCLTKLQTLHLIDCSAGTRLLDSLLESLPASLQSLELIMGAASASNYFNLSITTIQALRRTHPHLKLFTNDTQSDFAVQVDGLRVVTPADLQQNPSRFSSLLPSQYTSLRLHKWPQGMFNMLPTTLTSLCVSFRHVKDWQAEEEEFCSLPPTLKHLSIVPLLGRWNIVEHTPVSLSWLRTIPPQLETLELPGIHFETEESVTLLPHSLRTFILSRLPIELWEYLPMGLTSLECVPVCDEPRKAFEAIRALELPLRHFRLAGNGDDLKSAKWKEIWMSGLACL